MIAFLAEAAPPLAVAIITLLLGWVVGGRVTISWDVTKKRREFELAAAADFYAAYGDFFAVWKEWEAVYSGKFPDDLRPTLRPQLFRRACEAEGRIEKLLAKLASERRLEPAEVTMLGCFRQAYQTLRKAIQNDRAVGMTPRGCGGVVEDPWNSSESPSYLTFKALAMSVADLLERRSGRPNPADAAHALQGITSNRLEAPHWLHRAPNAIATASRGRLPEPSRTLGRLNTRAEAAANRSDASGSMSAIIGPGAHSSTTCAECAKALDS